MLKTELAHVHITVCVWLAAVLGVGYLEVGRGKLLPCRRETCLLEGRCMNTACCERNGLLCLSWYPLSKLIFPPCRNGPEFEARIRQNEINNPKFNFLNPNDPYHAYYRHKVSEFKEGKAQEPSAAIPKVMQQQQTAQQQLPQKVHVPFCFDCFSLIVSHIVMLGRMMKAERQCEGRA